MLIIKPRITALFISGCLLMTMQISAVSAQPTPAATVLNQSQIVAQKEVEVLRLEALKQEIRSQQLAALYANGYESWQEWARSKTDLARSAARAEAAIGLLADIDTLRQRLSNENDFSDDQPFPGGVCLFVLQSFPIEAGICVVDSIHRDLFVETLKLGMGRPDRQFDEGTSEANRLKSQIAAATEKVARLKARPGLSSPNNELTQANLTLQILEAKAARQEAIAELQRTASDWQRQCLHQLRQQNSGTYASRLVLISGAPNESSEARLAASQTATRLQDSQTRAVMSPPEQGHVPAPELRGAQARLIATKSQGERLREFFERNRPLQMKQMSSAVHPHESLKELFDNIPSSTMHNVSVVIAIVRLRQGIWEAWSARQEAKAKASFLRERELRLSQVSGASSNEKQHASFEREIADYEVLVADTATCLWDQTHAQLTSILSSDSTDRVQLLEQFLQRADVPMSLQATLPNAEALPENSRQLHRKPDDAESLIKNGHATALEAAQVESGAQTATALIRQFRPQQFTRDRDVALLRLLFNELALKRDHQKNLKTNGN